MTETLTWTPASTKPDADISVLCWRDTGEWFSGWYDDQAGAWFDCASGGIVDGVTPAAWRKMERGTNWYRYLQLTPKQGELFRRDGWEPLYRRQQAMAEAKARALARAHRGVSLVRAVEAEHGIH